MIGDVRLYGKKPYSVVGIHGGPGAAGYMAPVARELSKHFGVLEPFQTAASIEGQVLELKNQIMTHTQMPVTLVGSSWGAMLAIILAAEHPSLVKKLVLVGCAVLEECYARQIEATRYERLRPEEVGQMHGLMAQLAQAPEAGKNEIFSQLAALFTKADAFELLSAKIEVCDLRYDLFDKIWSEATTLRKAGAFLKWASMLKCPVTALHGDYDPHLAEGVRKPLQSLVDDFRFILLKRCGHLPWIEKYARDVFFEHLNEQLH